MLCFNYCSADKQSSPHSAEYCVDNHIATSRYKNNGKNQVKCIHAKKTKEGMMTVKIITRTIKIIVMKVPKMELAKPLSII